MSEAETAEPPAKRRRVVVGNTRPEPKVQAGVDIFSPPSIKRKFFFSAKDRRDYDQGNI